MKVKYHAFVHRNGMIVVECSDCEFLHTINDPEESDEQKKATQDRCASCAEIKAQKIVEEENHKHQDEIIRSTRGEKVTCDHSALVMQKEIELICGQQIS